jgi:hypothetical protein
MDWDNELTAIGVSRSTRHQAYIVALSLNHRQVVFGPFRESALEASNAHARLCHYFLPFVKERLAVEMPLAAFNALNDEETEGLYGKERLRHLKAQLTNEYKTAGLNICDEAEKRMNYVADPDDSSNRMPFPEATVSANRAIIALEKLSVKMVLATHKTSEIVNNARVSLEHRETVSELMLAATARQRDARIALDALVDTLKSIFVTDK